MITDHYQRLALDQIIVERDARQRREITFEEVKSLADSIVKNGVLNPIIITRDFKLVAGERRLMASRLAMMPDIPVRFSDALSATDLAIIELEENVKRKDLPWQDLVIAIARVHQLYKLEDEFWTQVETAEALAISEGHLSKYLKIFGEMEKNPLVPAAGSYIEAWNIIQRKEARAAGNGLQELIDTVTVPITSSPAVASSQVYTTLPFPTGYRLGPDTGVEKAEPTFAPVAPESIQWQSFLKWAPSYTGPKFNLVHCDFPYGIDVFAGPQGRGAEPGELYDDSQSIYFSLLECFCKHLNRFMSVSGHLMFWYSEKHGDATRQIFRELAPDLVFSPFPLIWVKSDNAGISPDARRSPRHVYETCLLASRGSRQIVRIAGDAYSAPTDRASHASAKPEPMLRHFMTMLVDETTSMFDPTCGSGSSLRAAESLGANSVLGFDINEETVLNTNRALKNSRLLRQASKSMEDL